MSQSSFIHRCTSLRIEHVPENSNEIVLFLETEHGELDIHLYGLSEMAIAQAFGALPPQAGDDVVSAHV